MRSLCQSEKHREIISRFFRPRFRLCYFLCRDMALLTSYFPNAFASLKRADFHARVTSISSPDAFGCAVPEAVPPVRSEFGSIQRHSCWSVMWSTTVLMVNTLTMLTIAHADRGRPIPLESPKTFF